MKFNKSMDLIRALTMLLVSSAVYGCAAEGSLIAVDRLSIERMTSENAAIENVHVHRVGAGVSIDGTIKFSRSRIGIPPGYLDVTIVTPGGKVFYTTHCIYYRYGRPITPSHTFNFATTIPQSPPRGSTVRLAQRATLRS